MKMPVATTPTPPSQRIKTGLACLLVGGETDAFDNGAPTYWKDVSNRLKTLPVGDRRDALRREIDSHPEIDGDALIGDLAAIDPNAGNEPDEDQSAGPAALPPAAQFPIEALPRSLGDYVREGAEAIGCPPDYIAIPLLASASAAIGTTVRLQIKSEWYEGTSLFTAVVAPSGAKKTPALGFALRFANEKSTAFDLEHQRNLETYERLLAEFHSAVDARKRDRGKPNQATLPDKPKRPTMKRTVVSDTTVEALAKRIKENPRGLLMSRDEMAGLLLGFNQYRGGRGNDLQFFLSVWSGVQTTIDRKQDEDPVVLHQPFLSTTGGIQPAVLPRILGKERLDDGFTARILFGDPDPLPHRPSDAIVQPQTIDRTGRTFDTLYRIVHESPLTTPPKPHLVRLTREARARFKEWEEAISCRIDRLSVDDPFRAPLSKMSGYLGRLALLLHVVKWAEKGTESFADIDQQTMKEAILLAGYFVAHSERVWSRLVESPEDTQMRQVRNWMSAQHRTVTARDIMRAGVAGLRRTSDVRAVIDRMVDCNVIFPSQIGRRQCFTLVGEAGGRRAAR